MISIILLLQLLMTTWSACVLCMLQPNDAFNLQGEKIFRHPYEGEAVTVSLSEGMILHKTILRKNHHLNR